MKDVINIENFGRRFGGGLDDLPQEVRDSLRLSSGMSSNIIVVLNDLAGVATLDEIMVGLYRKDNVIRKRPAVSMALHSLINDGTILGMGKKTGVYMLPSFRKRPDETTGKVEVQCLGCHTQFWARKSDVSRGRGKYCSNACRSVKHG